MLKYIVFIGIIYTAAAVLKISKHNGKEKSVNVALETVLEFDKENKQSDVNMLNKFHKFIGKVKNAIQSNNIKRRSMGTAKKKPLTYFIVNLIKSLLKYEDTDLETFVAIISKEINDYLYKDKTFHEITESIDYHRFLKHKLDKIRTKPAQDIRLDLKYVAREIEEHNLGREEKEIWDAFNSVYSEDTIPKCNELIRSVDNYRLKARKTNDLHKIVSGGLRTLLDIYSNLNVNFRSMIVKKIENYLRRLKDKKLQSTPDKQTTSTSKIIINKYVDLKELKKSYRYWLKDSPGSSILTTYITRRPRNVPTTKPAQRVSSKKSKPKKRNKLSKSNIDTYAYNKDDRKTTKELRTIRQMYVEKNLDLKYDPDAYKHLTTSKHRNKETIDPYSSISTQQEKHKNSKSVLRNKKSEHVGESSEESEKSSDEDSDSKDRNKLARQIRDDDQELYAIEPKHPNIIKLVKDIDYTIEVKKGADFDWSGALPYKQISRSKKKHKPDLSSKIDHDLHTMRLKASNIPNLRRHSRQSSEVKLKISRDPLVLLRQYDTTLNGRRQMFRTGSPIISEEDGMSIEGFDGRKHRKHFMRSGDLLTTMSAKTDNYILGRIQKLELELEKAKGKVISDTNVKESDKRNETSESYSDDSNISNNSKLDIEFNDKGNSNEKDRHKINIYSKGNNEQSKATRNTKQDHFTRKNYRRIDLGTFERNDKYNESVVHSSFENYININNTGQNHTDLDKNSTDKVIYFKINNDSNKTKLHLTEAMKNEVRTIPSTVPLRNPSTVPSRNPSTDNLDKSFRQVASNRKAYGSNNVTKDFIAEDSTTPQIYSTSEKHINTESTEAVFIRNRVDDETAITTNEMSTEAIVTKSDLFKPDNITVSNKTDFEQTNTTVSVSTSTTSHKITFLEVVQAKLASLSRDKKSNGKSKDTEVVITTQKTVNDTSLPENNQTTTAIM